MNLSKMTLVSLSVLTLASGAALASPSPADAARAEIQKAYGFVPVFLKALPDNALPGVWQEMKQFENADTALPGKIKGLIGLAVAAQIPSRSSIYAYTKCARSNGASEAETKEAVALSALTRTWSTYFNGAQLDEARFRAEGGKMLEHMGQVAAGKVAPPRPMETPDARAVFEDVKQSLGFVPEFVKKFPAEALPGAWTELKNVEFAESAIQDKYKSLITLGVASQIPCRYCIYLDTESAKASGATEREIHEAVTVAAMARHMTTLVEGLQLDEKALRRDLDRLMQDAPRPRMARAR
jgi:AhpD family alkylhydroperoxidase